MATTELPTIKSVLRDARSCLSTMADPADSDPNLDAEILLAYTLGRDRTWLYTWSDQTLSDTQQASFSELLKRRVHGEPVAHITGEREFWSLKLHITADTLVPRPDTETLVERALVVLEQHSSKGQRPDILDLGTGSGAIALALASEHPQAAITATDRSIAALQVARDNAEHLQLSNVDFVAGSWFEPLPPTKRFDLIISNPPYIAEADPHLRQGDLRYEPRAALSAGKNGLGDLCEITTTAPLYLKSEGWLLLEHGRDQGGAVRQFLQKAGFDEINTWADLAARDRVSGGRIP